MSPNKVWRVYVEGVGYVGSVAESSMGNARCAALSAFAREGDRKPGDATPAIFDDDTFNVYIH